MSSARYKASPYCMRRLVALALVLFYGGFGWAADLAPVSVVELQEQPIRETLRANGSVTSPQSAVLSPAVGGLIQSFSVDVGDTVAMGEVLVQLDDELAQLELDAAKANEKALQVKLEDATRRYNEAQKLSGASNIIPASEVESRRADQAIAAASLKVAAAEVRQQQAIVQRHTIVAPFAGVISERPTEVGEWVNPGSPLLRLVANQNLQFDFQMPQTSYRQIRNGMPVALRVDALPGLEFEGQVQAAVGVSNPGDRTFLLRVVAVSGDSDDSLRVVTPGMSAQAELFLDMGHTSIVVPRDALLRYPDGRTAVWIVEKTADGYIAREKFISIGVESDGRIEVRSGLRSGQLVVVRGNESLRDGQLVTLR